MYAQLHAGYNNGYSDDQVADSAITVQDLLERLQEAIADGDITPEDKVVLLTPGRYGANYYSITGMAVTGGEDEDDEDDEL